MHIAPHHSRRKPESTRTSPGHVALGLLGLLVIPALMACFCGSSAKPDVDEITRELATATRQDRTVTVSYRRTNRRKKQHMDQLFPDDFYTITEAIWLEGPQLDRFTLEVQSNRDGKILMKAPRAEVLLSPTADRVACKINDGPWRILFLVNDSQWLRAPKTLDSSSPPDWSKLPSLPDYTEKLYLYYGTYNEHLDYSPVHRDALLEHYGRLQGEEALVDLIFKVKDHPSTNSYAIGQTIKALPPKAKEMFDARLVKETLSREAPELARINQLLEFVEVSSPALREDIIRLARHYTAQSVERRDYSSKAASNLLLQAARQDLDTARTLAEQILTRHSPELARPGKEGWLMRTTALTIIARSGKPAAIVPSMISQTPCEHGYAIKGGGLISKSRALEVIDEEFEHGPTQTSYHRPQDDGLFVLGAMYGTGQPLPESLRTLTCPTTTK